MEEAYLVPEASPLKRHRLGALTAIGRHPDNTLEVPDRSVSKFHAQIQRAAGGSFVLQDLGSRNGTFVAGQRIQRHELGDGDELVLGTVKYRFRMKGAQTVASIGGQTVALSSGGLTMLGPSTARTGAERISLAQNEGDGAFAEGNTFSVDSADQFLPAEQVTDVDELRRDYEKLRVAHELSAALRLDMPPDELLRVLATRIFDILAADRCAILLMSKDGTSLEPVVAMESGGGEPKDEIRLSQTVLREVIAGKKAILSTDASTDGRFNAAASIVALSIRSAMSVPMVFEEELLGVIHVDSQQRRGAFTQKDLQIFTSIAGRAAAALKNAGLMADVQRETETRARLGRLLSPNLVEEVVNGKLDLALGGEKRTAAVLFSDIRGFTSMSEQLDASAVTDLLNEYFEIMVDVLFQHRGTLDKYLGDGMMALFGVPKEEGDFTADAVRCALNMQSALSALNRTRESRGEPPLEIGIGINLGEVIWGPLGSRKTMDYTVVGDVVNTSARLCGIARPGEVLITHAVRAQVGARFDAVELPPATVKGKAEPVRVFSVRSERQTAEIDGQSPG
jgi:adenylate cyclase